MVDGRGAYVAAFATSILAVAAAYASAFLPGGPPGWAPWAMAAGIAGALASMMAVGAARDGGPGPLGPIFLFVFVVLAAGFGAALLLEGGGSKGASLWLGLPPPAAVILYGVGLLPLLIVPGAYALTFEALTLGDAEWERIRALREESHAARPPDAGPEPADGRALDAVEGSAGPEASPGGAGPGDAG